ncbi:MAG: MmcQ/YjbR family DNA-binding protein [Pseudomonadota bacterium]
MARAAFNAFCAALPATTHVVQWGGADVWKVGGKVFAIAGWNHGADAYTFKVSDLAFEVLPDMPGLRPAPYMASRGLKWVQLYDDPGLSDVALKEHLCASYDMVVSGLTRRIRTDLNI